MIVYLSDSKEVRELTTHRGSSSRFISLKVVILIFKDVDTRATDYTFR